jgi:hypothetical protein
MRSLEDEILFLLVPGPLTIGKIIKTLWRRGCDRDIEDAILSLQRTGKVNTYANQTIALRRPQVSARQAY